MIVAPEGWRTTTLGELCTSGGGGIQTGPFGSQLHASDYVLAGIPSVMPQNIGDNVIEEEGIARISEEDATRLSKYLLREHDIVYSRRGDVEKRALVRGEHAGWLCGTGCLRVRFGDRAACDPRFVSHYLGTESSRTWIKSHAVGATMPNLNTSILAAFPIVLPSYAEQRAIAEVLGALDDKIAANRKLTSTADQLADAQFAMFTVATQADPLGHNMVTIGELGKLGAITFGDGYRTKRSELADEGFRILRVADVFGGEIHLDSTDFVEYGRRSAIGAKAAQVGDIVLTTKGTVGRLAVFEGTGEDVVYSPQVCFFRVGQNDIVERSYLRRWFSSPSFVSQASYRKGNTDMADYINLSDIGSLAISLPNIESQRALGEILEPLDALVASLRKESRYLVALRDTLIPRLMAGELRVHDAEKAVENVL